MNRKIVLGLSEGAGKPAKLLGGKGHGLALMSKLGVPVPPAITLTTTLHRSYRQYGKLPKRFVGQLDQGIRSLEAATGKRFGDPTNPLLVSVRSGSVVSMPGMMDTILNLGMTPEIAERMENGKELYRRFLTMFGDVVLEIKSSNIEKAVREKVGDLIDDPRWQLSAAIFAVLRSWDSERALLYRAEHKIPAWYGTAVNIQAMVFGNLGDDCCTGVVFSRDVSTGAKGLYGEYLINAQGEDIVSGARTPSPIKEMMLWNPKLYRELEKIVKDLELHFKDVVDVEFTVEKGKLFILQVRPAKRTPEAAVTVATHFVWEEMWSKDEAVARSRKAAREVERPGFDAKELDRRTPLAMGLPASPGAAVGVIALSSEMASRFRESGQDCILVRPDTSPDDLAGMLASEAVVTCVGGLTSHAAVVARGLGRPAIVGVGDITWDDGGSILLANGQRCYEGEVISVDGASGRIYHGEIVRSAAASKKKEINIFFKWMAEFALPVPAPRIGFEYVKEGMSFNRLINDFYLLDAMAMAAGDKGIGNRRYQDYRDEYTFKTAERLAAYITVAVAGELRHSWGQAMSSPPPPMCGHPLCLIQHEKEQEQRLKSGGYASREVIGSRWGINRGDGRGTTQRRVIEALKNSDKDEHIEFLSHAEAVFRHLPWGSGYGGKKWAQIAAAPLRFLKGELSHSMFSDHVFDLQHNGGCVFGKHEMLNGSRDAVKKQLDRKKMVSGVRDLHKALGRFLPFSPEVQALFDSGVKEKLW